MKTVHDNRGEYHDVINSYYDLESYSNDNAKSVLFQGYSSSTSAEAKNAHLHYENRIYLNLESPCAFCSSSSFVEEQKFFTHTYTICPYTLKWLNKEIGIKGSAIAFPYSASCFSNLDLSNKDVASMYMGTIMCEDHESVLEIISRRSHFITSLSHHPKLTHRGISSFQKWDLLARVKTNAIINLCPIGEDHKKWIKGYKNFYTHEAFKKLEGNFIPQFKPRVIESMVCRAVCLVKKDPWNVIENWFVPDKDFIYWESPDELDQRIEDIDKNYENYTTILDNASKKVERFEIKNIIRQIERDINE
tara:strand:+ start:711 stop:1625 length:915 start_codon:yes stop_codon:yes gene_type:complete